MIDYPIHINIPDINIVCDCGDMLTFIGFMMITGIVVTCLLVHFIHVNNN